MIPGISTLGVKFGYGVEEIAGQKPSAFTGLTRINQLGGISLNVEQIDASALEDFVTRYVAGRADSGGTFPVTVNLTEDTVTEWETLIKAYKAAKKENKSVWFETWHPTLKNGFYLVAEPPTEIPQPETAQNGLWTVEMTLIINEYKGMLPAIEPEGDYEEEEDELGE